MPMSFKEAHPEFQHLVRELTLVRNHNLRFKEGDPQHELLLFAEGALACLTLERFARAVCARATDQDTLPNLLQKCVKDGLFKLGGIRAAATWKDQQEAIERVVKLRNTILHGNYEQAAREAKCASVAEYFRTQYASEVEAMYQITDFVAKQIDPDTGKPYEKK